MFSRFSRRHFAKLAGLSALGMAARRRSRRRQRQAGSRPPRARAVSEGFRLGHRHLVLPDRRRRQRRRPRPFDLGHVFAHAGQDRATAAMATAPTIIITATRKTSA